MVIVILTLTAYPIEPDDHIIDATMSPILGQELMMEETEEVL